MMKIKKEEGKEELGKMKEKEEKSWSTRETVREREEKI